MFRDSPYQGLRPFAEEDAAFFFGRETETRIISANLRTRRLTLLYGPSGVGKSSVLQAGVLHTLHQLNTELQLKHAAFPDDDFEKEGRIEENANTSAEGGHTSGESTKSIVVVTFEKWIDDPHSSLKEGILTSLNESLPSIFTPKKNDELRQLGLRDMLHDVAGYSQVMELLIILDQFEQYFVYHEVDRKPEHFADEFCRAVSSRKLRANFLVSIREDWLASLDLFTGHVPSVFENSIRIAHMDLESARAAIWNPVLKYNELIGKHEGQPVLDRKEVTIEDSFVSEALNQLEQLNLETEDPESPESSSEPKSDKHRIQASGLQIVLQHIWNKVKNNDAPTLSKELLPRGTARRIFRSHVDESLEHLNFFEKNTAEKLFPLLITSSGTKLADTAKSLSERSGCRTEAVQRLIKKLTKTRILNEHAPLSARAPLPLYEITSDVLAVPIRNWVRGRRLKRRKVARFAWLIVAGVVIVVGVAWLAVRIQQRLLKAEQQRKEADSRVNSAKWENLRRSLADKDKEVPYLKAVLRGHSAIVTSAVFTSDGQVLTASADGSAVLWDPETTDPVRQFGNHDLKPIVCTAIDPNGNSVVTANTDGTVWIWTRSTGDSIQLRGRVGKHVTGVSFSPGGDLIAAANTVGDLMVWNSSTLELVANKSGNGKPTLQLSFSPSGKFLGTGSDDFSASVWRVGDWSRPMVMTGHGAKVNGLAFSPDEQSLATVSADATVRLWGLNGGQPLEFIGHHSASINSVAFDRSGQRLLTASDDGTARIWNVSGGRPIELNGHGDKVLSAAFSPNGLQVVTASRDATARIWSARSAELLVELQGHSDQVTYVSYSKDGKYVLTASDDATARVWFAPESGLFEIDPPVIKANPIHDYHGPCPVTIVFEISITTRKGIGTVIYRFKDSDGRIWPAQEVVFDKPGIQYLKWYRRIKKSMSEGVERIEVIEPKGIKEEKATFKVTCTANETAPSEVPPTTTSQPAFPPSPSPTSSVVPAPSPPPY